MMFIDCSTMYLPLIAQKLGNRVSPLAQCISCVDDKGEVIAGAIFDDYNTASIHIHVWIKEGRTPSRDWIYAIMDYPFNKLQIGKLIAAIGSWNSASIAFSTSMGCTLEAKVTGFFPDGDAMIYTMTKDQCTVLNSTLWKRCADKFARAA